MEYKFSYKLSDGTIKELDVNAGNEDEARRIAEDHIWTHFRCAKSDLKLIEDQPAPTENENPVTEGVRENLENSVVPEILEQPAPQARIEKPDQHQKGKKGK
jgi:hypothetical protein